MRAKVDILAGGREKLMQHIWVELAVTISDNNYDVAVCGQWGTACMHGPYGRGHGSWTFGNIL